MAMSLNLLTPHMSTPTTKTLKHKRQGKFKGAFLEYTIYRPGLWFRDAESAEIMITVSVRGGFTSHELLSHVQGVIDQFGHL